MKKVLGIVASKRRLGNCEIMLKEISRRISTPHELQLLRLPDFRLAYCTGCFRCLAGDRTCVLKDDLEQILEAIASADAIILAVPCYVLGAPACVKTLLDRALSFYGKGDRLWGKPAVGIGVAGREGKEGATLLDLERFFAVLQMENRMSRIVYAALPGEVVLSEPNLEVAGLLSRALFGSVEKRNLPCCPLCGGETFRFLSDNRVRCMLCSASGTIFGQDGGFSVQVDPREHQFLMGKEEAAEHCADLSETRERFEAQKARLKGLVARYVNEGSWIEPGRITTQQKEQL
ncbi:MAG: flavodoxin family protein [Desulfuromonadaceae bacterium]|nr:flavodoxin family protein [Desulfuromonadaceae bacterium]